MNIGIDARLWSESGVGRYIRNLVGGIKNSNADHTFTLFLQSEQIKNIEFEDSRFKKIAADSRWHTLSEQWKFLGIIKDQDIDLMHFPYFSYPIFYRKPFVITIHDLIIDHFPTGVASSLPLPVYKLKHYAYRKITQSSVKNSRKIIVPSKATKEELHDHYNAKDSKIEVIYEGFDPVISSKKNSSLVSKNYILYVGNAYPHKNLERLLKAFEKISAKVDVDLVCIGREDFFYQRLKKNSPKRVLFLHNIADWELFNYYTNARLLAMPTLMEGFGLPILEAMSLSCPVVCSDISALREIAQDSVAYCDPLDADSIAETMLKVLSDDKLKQTLVKKGKKRSQHFSWKECVDKTIKVYESCDSV